MAREKIIPSSRILKKTWGCSGDFVNIPLVSIGPSGIGGEYQEEKVE